MSELRAGGRDAEVSAAFSHWSTYFLTASDTIVRHLPLTLPWGKEPPLELHRNGIPCIRIVFDVDRRVVAYAVFGAVADIRAAVRLVQSVHGEQ